MNFRDQIFDGEDVSLDGNVFTGCTFRNCRIIYRGTATLTFNANHIKENVQWVLEGAAGATVAFLTDLYHGMGEGGRDLVEKTFENIRRGKHDKSP